MATPAPEIKNRKASYEYHILERFEAGMQLYGTEVKSLRGGNANLSDAYCVVRQDEVYALSIYIAEYEGGNQFNHETRRERKLLLKKQEIRKIDRKLREKGYTLVPLRIFFSDRGLAKLEIGLAQGKKAYDKRDSIKQKDLKRDLERARRMD